MRAVRGPLVDEGECSATRYATREIRLASALVEAADTLAEGFEATRYLQRISDCCVELLNARAAGVMLIDGGRSVSPAASSRHEQVALDLLEAQHGGGPCLDSYGSGEPVPPVSIRVAHADARWPDFTERALGHDIVTTFAVPLRRRENLLGALNVFVPTLPDPTPADEAASGLHVAQALADAAALGLQNRSAYAQYRALSGQLEQALSSRVRRGCSPSAGVSAPTGRSWRYGSTRGDTGCRWTRWRARSSRAWRTTPSCAGRAAEAPTDPRRTLHHQVAWRRATRRDLASVNL
ncbi:GAF domain-containing protein [Streptomyces sp. NBC_00882]|uniref:GAF domain-containing protein n=1 Tax=Streptomyces sp. NBC_00882 TaxID=2975856 RepID=UPI00386377E2|nr:GAF domain-containing protein [Streptomyces sp. NBC_00882]